MPGVSSPGYPAASAARRAAALDAFGGTPDADVARVIEGLAAHAPSLLPLALSDPSLAEDVARAPLERALDAPALTRAFAAVSASAPDGATLRRELRRLRHRSLVRIALREGFALAGIDQTSHEISVVATAATHAALDYCLREACAKYGTPVDASGRAVPIVVLGMGKLGGDELNLGSDVDLCFFYGTDEAEVPGGALTVHELYARVAAATSQVLSEVTEDGFCFRVDLRLRPEGASGALVNSVASAERYYEAWGRTWERAALSRACPVAGDLALGRELLEALRPFVFRRAVDPKIAFEMAELLRRARREAHDDSERDLKLGRGGIREAEFFVQSLQLVWGGRHPELRVAGTLEALARLERTGLVTGREARELGRDWALLRRVEHRLHAFVGYQTHVLPEGELCEAIAASLGLASGQALERLLAAARARVATLFATLEIGEAPSSPELEALVDRVAAGATAAELAAMVAEVLPVHDPDEAASHLRRLGRRARSPLGPVLRESEPRLGSVLLREVADAADPDDALRSLADFFGRLGGQWPYEKLLGDDPILRRRLIGLFGTSATLSSALIGHPEDVDLVLASGGVPSEVEILGAHDAPDATTEDPEVFVAWLRRIKRELTLRVGLAYVADEIDLDALTSRMSTLAEAQVRASFARARADVERPREPRQDGARAIRVPPLCVVAMGKLGGRELGIGGDLDLVFLYASDSVEPTETEHGQGTAELCTRIAQRTMRLLSQPDAEGPGYPTDVRLRPSGSHGMLVVSMAAFDRYHVTHAAPWERQALVRARPIAGDGALAPLVRARAEDLAYRRGAVPAADLAQMRGRLEAELSGERRGRYRPKLGYGGLVDVEFVVQWLQMRHGDDERLHHPGTLDALRALATVGLVSGPDAERLETGYRFMRGVEQALRLVDEAREPLLIESSRDAVRVARRLGLRAPDGAATVLVARYVAAATRVRDVFERVVAPIGRVAPWTL